MALWILLLILYRDLGVSFIRQIATKRGVTMGARPSGKLKAWVYAIAGVLGMALVTVDQVRLHASVERIVRMGARTVFILCAVIAVASLIDYAWGMLKTAHARSNARSK